MSDSADLAHLPTTVRTRLAHASAQAVATRVGADILHIKGASLDPALNPGRPDGADADVLVRPAHVKRFVAGLRQYEWTRWCDFDEGSLFEHAASFHHPYLGMLDVHQNFPGMHRDPELSFDELWGRRIVREIGGVPCAAPDPVGEHLVMLLHAARTVGRGLDVENHWFSLDPAHQDQIRSLSMRLHAEVGLKAAIGTLDDLDSPEADLWRLSVNNADRLGEWRARWRNAGGVRARVALVRRAARVNRFVLGQSLGHPPTRADIRREWWRRAGSGLTAAAAVARDRVVLLRRPS